MCLYLSFQTKVVEFCVLCLHIKAGLVYLLAEDIEAVSAEMLPDCDLSKKLLLALQPTGNFFFFQFFPPLLSPHWGCVTALVVLSLY